MIIQESQLVNSIKCPLYDRDIQILESCALKVLRSALLASFNKNPYKLSNLRELFVKHWDEVWLKDHKDIPTTGPYWEGPKAARTVATKIYSLLLYNEVLQPILPYDLVIQTYTIQGEYALLKGKGKSGSVSILVPHTIPYFRTEPPEPTGLLRFWHVTGAFTMYRNVRVLHFPMLRGRNSWQDFKDLPLVLAHVHGIVLSYIGKNVFPRTGFHCESCKSKKCMEVFNVGSHDHPWQRQLAQIRNRRK